MSRRIPTALAIAIVYALAARGELPSPKVLERYRQMIMANPVDGTALDRLWKAHAESGETAKLVAQFRRDETFAGRMIIGHLLRRSGDPEGALAAYRGAAQLQPKSPLPLRAEATVLKEQGRAADAATAIEKAAQLLPPDSPQRRDLLLDIGEAWLEAGDQARAADAWEQTAAMDPGNLELRRKLADTYIRSGLAERALPHLQAVAAKAPPADRAATYQQLASVHQVRGEVDAAISALEHGVALTRPGNWLRDELLNALIRLHQREGRVPELERRWERHTAENPRDLGGYLQLLQLYERSGELEKQRTWLEKLSALAPKTQEYRRRLANLLIRMDDFPAAIRVMDALLAEQPRDLDLAFERAKLDVLIDSPGAARKRIADLVQRFGADETVKARALAFYQRHRFWDAVEAHLAAEARAGTPDAIVALAEFLFSNGRGAEAEQQLHGLVIAAHDSAEKASALQRVSRILKSQGRIEASARAAEQALAELPTSGAERRALLLFAGEIYSTMDRPARAQAAYEEALALSRTPTEEQEADHRLFEAVRQQAHVPAELGSHIGLMNVPGLDLGTADEPNQLGNYLARIRESAENAATGKSWLRLAQWHSWRRDTRSALDAANKALAIEPGFTPAHEFIVQLTSGDANSPTAAWHLEKLAESDSPGRNRHRRHAAQIELQRSRPEEALRILESILKEEPGNREALIDLATVQQRLERWTDALATWSRVHAASPASQRSESLNALLRVYEQLEQAKPAAELLLREIDSRNDSSEKQDRFTDLLAVCTDARLLPWLRERWEERRRRMVNDYFSEQAMARIMKAEGNRRGAFELLTRASFSAPDPAAALPELVREAEELYRLDDAVALQVRLVRLTRSDAPDALIRLAELQERNFSFSAASETWQRVISRHPRDTAALMMAVDFNLRDDNRKRAVEVLQRVRAIEPANTRAALTLADLHLQSGALAEARKALEDLLALVPGEKPGDPISFPALKSEDGNRLQSAYLATVRNRGGQPKAEAMRDLRTFWTATSPEPTSAKAVRLNVIRKLAEVVKRTGETRDRKTWVQRWQTSAPQAPGESLWALFYVGANREALDLIAGLMQREPENVQYRLAFIWIGLRTSSIDRLASWLQAPERTASDRDMITIAIGQHLDSGGAVDRGMLDRLLTQSAPSRLWQVASLLAARARFELAIHVGQKAFAQPGPHRDSMGVELAHWFLCVGKPQRARETLGKIARNEATSFDAPPYTAQRELFLLLSPEDRQSFVDRATQPRPGESPIHHALTGALLHGLTGDEQKAKAHLDHLFQMRVMANQSREDQPSATLRPWTFLLSTGLRLQAWKLDSLAEYLWEQSLADPTLVRLHGEHAEEIAREIRVRLAALKLARLPLQQLPANFSDLLRSVPKDDWSSVGEALESLGANAHAVQLYRLQWDLDPTDPQPLRNLLNACRLADDRDAAESVLRACVTDRRSPNDAVQRDFALQLVDLLDRRFEHGEAVWILTAIIQRAPRDTRLQQRLAELHEAGGRYDEAEKVWKGLLALDSGHPIARTALAALQENHGRFRDAIATLKQSGDPDPDPRIAVLMFKVGAPEAAMDTIKEVPSQHAAAAVEALADEFVAVENRQHARAALQAAMSRTTDPSALFRLRRKLVETFKPNGDGAKIGRELRNLHRSVRDDTERLAAFHSWLGNNARALGAEPFARDVLSQAWDDGRGPLHAGVALTSLYIVANNADAVRTTVDQLLTREDVTAPTLEGFLPRLEARFPAIATSVHERLTRLDPMDDRRVLAWVQSIRTTESRERALEVLRDWGARAWLDEEFAARVAELQVALEAPAEAEQLFSYARQNDMALRNHSMLLAYGDFKRGQGDMAGSRVLLASAYQNPGCRDFAPLVRWLASANRLENLEREGDAFLLSPRQRADLRQAVLQHYVTNGNTEAAIETLKTIVDPSDPVTLRAIDALARTSGDPTPLLDYLERWITEEPAPLSWVLETAALLHFQQAERNLSTGDEAAAMSHLEKAVTRGPWLYAPARTLASLQEKRGLIQQAAASLDVFLSRTQNARERAEAAEFRRRLSKGDR
jgi:tetratricopeptide (TPR) repeat protein